MNVFFNEVVKKYKVKFRNTLNPFLGPLRRWFGGVNKPFTIISNNCWGGIVYQHYNLPYDSPTVGLYFYADEYIKFVSNLHYYLSQEITFISYEQSKYKDDIVRKKQTSKPIWATR